MATVTIVSKLLWIHCPRDFYISQHCTFDEKGDDDAGDCCERHSHQGGMGDDAWRTFGSGKSSYPSILDEKTPCTVLGKGS